MIRLPKSTLSRKETTSLLLNALKIVDIAILNNPSSHQISLAATVLVRFVARSKTLANNFLSLQYANCNNSVVWRFSDLYYLLLYIVNGTPEGKLMA